MQVRIPPLLQIRKSPPRPLLIRVMKTYIPEKYIFLPYITSWAKRQFHIVILSTPSLTRNVLYFVFFPKPKTKTENRKNQNLCEGPNSQANNALKYHTYLNVFSVAQSNTCKELAGCILQVPSTAYIRLLIIVVLYRITFESKICPHQNKSFHLHTTCTTLRHCFDR